MADGSMKVELSLETEFKKIQEEIDDARKELESMGEDVNFDFVDNLQAKLDELKNSANTTEDDVRKLADAVKEYAVTTNSKMDASKPLNKTEKAAKSLKNRFDSAKQAVKKYKDELETIAHAIPVLGQVTQVLDFIGDSFNEVKKAIGEGMELYRDFEKAETALQAAAKNNPYINGAAASGMRDYAKQLSTTTGKGTEEIMQMMTSLVASGRKQEEIQKIIKTAIDVSASGFMEFEGAVKHMNRSLGGMAGEIGELVPEIRAMSQEELKAGGAIDLLAERYKGMAKAVNDVSSFENAISSAENLKRELGTGWEMVARPFRDAFTSMRNAMAGWLAEMNKASSTKKALGSMNSNGKEQRALANSMDDAERKYNNKLSELQAYYEQISILENKLNNISDEGAKKRIENEIAVAKARVDVAKSESESLKETWGLAVSSLVDADLNAIKDKSREELLSMLDFLQKEFEKSAKDLKVDVDALFDIDKDKLESLVQRAISETQGAVSKNQLGIDWFGASDKRGPNGISLANGSVVEGRNGKANQLLEAIDNRQKIIDALKKVDVETAEILTSTVDTSIQDKYNKAVEKYKQTLAQFEAELKHRKATGEEITQEAEAQERLNVTTRAYIAMRMEAGSAMSDDNSFAKEQLVYVSGLADAYGKLAEESGNYAKVIDEINALCDETEGIVEQSVKFIEDMAKADREVSDAVLEQVNAIDERKEALKKETDALKEKVLANEKAIASMDAESPKARELAAENERLTEQINRQTEAEENLSRARDTAIRQLGDQVDAEKELTRIKKEQALLDSAKSLIQDRRTKKQKRKDEDDTLSKAKDTLTKKVEPSKEKLAQIDAEIQAMQEAAGRGERIEEEKLAKMLALREKYADDVADLERQITDVVSEQAGRQKDALQEKLQEIGDFVSQASQAVSTITGMMQDRVSEQADAERTALAEQYNSGEIDYETYCEKKAEIERKFAREQYKIELAEWGNKVLLATANTALAVINAMTGGDPYTAPIRAAIAGALGAIQIASVVASKPKAPSFAGGGIVPGRSYSGDRVQANVNSGEMILNASQQKQLWGMANGQNAVNGSTVLNVKVINNASDSTRTSQSLDPDGLVLTIDKIVGDSMRKGKYNSSMDAAQAVREGERWL